MVRTYLEMLHALKVEVALMDGPRNGQGLQLDGGVIRFGWCQRAGSALYHLLSAALWGLDKDKADSV